MDNEKKEKTPKELPQKLNEIPVLKPNAPNRTLVLVEAMMDGNPTGIFANMNTTSTVTSSTFVGHFCAFYSNRDEVLKSLEDEK